MKNKLLFIALFGLVTASCASSCHSCSESSPPTPSVESQTSGGGGLPLPSSTGSVDPSTDGICVQIDGALECSTDHASSSSGSTVPEQDNLVQGDTWQISVPQQFKEKISSQKNIVLSKLSTQDRVLLVLLKEAYQGSYDDYTLGSVRSFKEGGASVVSTKPVEVNGNRFLSLEIMKGDVKILNLISYKSGQGYTLSCGGPPPYDSVVKLCSSILSHFTIK